MVALAALYLSLFLSNSAGTSCQWICGDQRASQTFYLVLLDSLQLSNSYLTPCLRCIVVDGMVVLIEDVVLALQ